MWNAGKPDLEGAGLSFHVHHGSKKCSLAVAELDDITEMFNTLGLLDKLPEMNCKANNLLGLLLLIPGPVSGKVKCEQLDDLKQSVT